MKLEDEYILRQLFYSLIQDIRFRSEVDYLKTRTGVYLNNTEGSIDKEKIKFETTEAGLMKIQTAFEQRLDIMKKESQNEKV